MASNRSAEEEKTVKEEVTEALIESVTRLSDGTEVNVVINRLSSFLSGFQLSNNNSAQQSEYASKFSKEFSVCEILGIGGFGCVFKAKNNLDEWDYAVKRIAVEPKKDDAETKRTIAKALREVRAMAQLDHPGIVRYNSTWIEEPPEDWQYDTDGAILESIKSKKHQLMSYKSNCVFIYIQMQLCNFSLAQWLSDNMAGESRVLPRVKSWFKQIVTAVEYLHDKGLIHRDLKPENILFVEKDKIKICDLGIVIEQKLGEDGKEVTVSLSTGSSSRHYASPEQQSLLEPRLSTKSDIFTLGLILAELCVPMEFEKKVKIFENYRRGRENKIFEDERTSKFIGSLTELDKKKRPTCRQMLDDLYLA